jgi:hypothetical protein
MIESFENRNASDHEDRVACDLQILLAFSSNTHFTRSSHIAADFEQSLTDGPGVRSNSTAQLQPNPRYRKMDITRVSW